MITELDRVAYLLEAASKSLSAGQHDEAGVQLSEARGILDQALEAVVPAAIKPASPADDGKMARIKRKTPAA
jgi:hypothetical protein